MRAPHSLCVDYRGGRAIGEGLSESGRCSSKTAEGSTFVDIVSWSGIILPFSFQLDSQVKQFVELVNGECSSDKPTEACGQSTTEP